MSGTFPVSPAFNSVEVNSIQPTFVSRTISGRRQARQIAGQFFTMSATFPPMTRAEFAPISAFIMKQRGQFESFQVVLPVLSSGLGSPLGTPLVKGASQTGRSIITDGWSPPASGNVLTLSDTTPDVVWDVSQGILLNNEFLQTSGSGTGFTFNSETDESGNPTITIYAGGQGFAVSDTITLRDTSATPTSAIATVTVATIVSAGINELTDYTPTLSGNWEYNYSVTGGIHYNATQQSTSGSGSLAKFTLTPTGWSGAGAVTDIDVTLTKAGKGYAVDDTLVIVDPGSTSNTITLTVKSITASTDPIFNAGDYLKFANHDKVYTVTADVDADSSGDATISIEPPLITSPADNSAITHTSVPFTVALSNPVQSFATGTSGLFSYELDFAEVL